MKCYPKPKKYFDKRVLEKLYYHENNDIKNWYSAQYGSNLLAWKSNKSFRFNIINDSYYTVYKHIKNKLYKMKMNNIIDIGCHKGTQSELFYKEFYYIGIDDRRYTNCFFNHNERNVKYIYGIFPNDINLDISNSILISIGAIGQKIDPNMKHEKNKQRLINQLKKAQVFYTDSNSLILDELKSHFTIIETLQNNLCCLRNNIIKKEA